MKRSMCQSAKDYFETMRSALESIDYALVDKLVEILIEARNANRQIFVCGNGGSASTAGHFGLEFVMTGGPNGPKALKVHSLSDNIGLITAIANDLSYDDIYRYQLTNYAASGDVLLAITGSGNSPNILNACEWAKDHGLTVVALTGFDGGKVQAIAELSIHVPSNNYGIIEDLHMSIGHVIGQRLHQMLPHE